MDELNNLETITTADVVVEEQPIVEVKPVEPVIEETPTPAPVAPVETPKPILAPKPVTPKEDKNLVSIYSAKDFVSVSKGYSKVNKNLAESLLNNKNVRLATEEEIKAHLNK